MDNTTDLPKVFTRLKSGTELHLKSIMKTTEMTFFSYMGKTEVAEEEINGLLDAKV